jgi:hypothetical protein
MEWLSCFPRRKQLDVPSLWKAKIIMINRHQYKTGGLRYCNLRLVGWRLVIIYNTFWIIRAVLKIDCRARPRLVCYSKTVCCGKLFSCVIKCQLGWEPFAVIGTGGCVKDSMLC